MWRCIIAEYTPCSLIFVKILQVFWKSLPKKELFGCKLLFLIMFSADKKATKPKLNIKNIKTLPTSHKIVNL